MLQLPTTWLLNEVWPKNQKIFHRSLKTYRYQNLRLDYYIQGQRYNRVYNLASDYLEGWDELGAQITVSDSDDSWFVQFYGQNITDNESIYYRNLESTAVGNYQRIMARERARYGVRAGWNF